MKKLLMIIGTLFLFFSCNMSFPEEEVVVVRPPEPEPVVEPEPEPEKTDMDVPAALEIEERQWTIMIYMSADNNLESYAIEDLTEMELSTLNTAATTVLVLLDRNPAYDTTNDNWYGTKLYRLNTGRSAEAKQFISEEIDCKELGLVTGVETELDLSSDYTLSNFISFSKQRYPAEHYGLIIWGHGTGWRNIEELEPETNLFKGFAFDETSKTYMTLHQMAMALKNGLNGQKLDLLGFDTCFGGELEVVYELKEYAEYFVGSEGLLMSSGWNYEALFSGFQNEGSGTTQALCTSIIDQFRKQYGYSNRASIVQVKMDEVQKLFTTFDNLCLKVAEKITSAKIRDDLLKLLYSSKDCITESYSYGTSGNDIYLDIFSMAQTFSSYFNSNSEETPEIQVAFEDFITADSATIQQSWASDRERGGLGVYFSSLRDGNLLAVTYPAAYIRDKTVEQILFVKDSQGYVPNNQAENSLLQNLFFKTYE